jgi:predicted signal transduction protein with EAL and GGDEF domain
MASPVVQRLARPTYIGREQVAVSSSVGVAFAADAAADSESFMRNADLALYAAKKDRCDC